MPTLRETGGGMDEEDIDHYDQDEEEDSGSGSCDDQMDDDEGGSSEMDFEECDRRKTECIDDMSELSEQFCKIKDQLFSERASLIDLKLKDIEKGIDPEYLSRVSQLEQIRKHRLQVTDVLIELRRAAIQEIFKSEELANLQNMENDKDILYDQQRQDLEDKIKRLEEDRHSIDITSDLYECNNQKKKKPFQHFTVERRKKPAQVTGPFIVYNLTQDDIVNDWTVIKRATKQQVQRRKIEL